MEDIIAFLEDPAGLEPGHAAVVVTGDGPDRDLEAQVLVLAGIQRDGLSVSAQDSGGFSEFPLRGLAVNLDNFLAGNRTGVDHARPEGDRVVADALHTLPADLESRVRQAVSEGVHDLFSGKCLKIAIPHIDILRIEVPVGIAEIGVGRVIADIVCDGIGKLSAGGDLAGQHVEDAVSALLAALPDVENGGGIIFCHPFHIDDIAHVEKDNGSWEGRADPSEHDLLLLRQVIASSLGLVVLVFAGRPADDHDGGLRLLRGRAHKFLGGNHLLLEPGLRAPAVSLVEGMIRKPGLIGLLEGRRKDIGLSLKDSLPDAGHIVGVHHAAGAGSALVVAEAAAAEERHAAPLCKGKGVIPVLQHDDSFRLRLAGDGRVDLCVKNRILHKSVLHHRQRDSLLARVHADDGHVHDVADAHHFERVFDELFAHFGDVDQSVLMDADIHKSAEVHDIADGALELKAGL